MPRTETRDAEAPTSTTAPPAARRRAGRRRVLRGLIAIVAGLIVTGWVSEAVLAARDTRAHPPPGELVELGDGRMLHLDVRTRGSGGPTVALEAGAGIPSSFWRPTVDALLETVEGPVTVVAYDRAGTAWSGAGRGAPTPDVVVADLREALAAQGLPGPFVLVGHSIGGHYARAFAAAHPDEVVGVVLVDPSHEEASARLPELMDSREQNTRLLRWGARLRPFGIARLFNHPADHLPTELAEQLYALELNRDHLRGSLAFEEALDEIDGWIARHARDLGDVPLHIVSAGHIPGDEPFVVDLAEVLDELHREMTAMSTDATRHVIADADHTSIVTDPVHAREVATHIADLLISDH